MAAVPALSRLPSIPKILVNACVDTAPNNDVILSPGDDDVGLLPGNDSCFCSSMPNLAAGDEAGGRCASASHTPAEQLSMEAASRAELASPAAGRNRSPSDCLALTSLLARGRTRGWTEDASSSSRKGSTSSCRCGAGGRPALRRLPQQQALLRDAACCSRCGDCSSPAGGRSDLSMRSDSALSLCATVSSFRLAPGLGPGGGRVISSERLDCMDAGGGPSAAAMLRRGVGYYYYGGEDAVLRRAWSEGELYRASYYGSRLGPAYGGIVLRRDSLSCCNLRQPPGATHSHLSPTADGDDDDVTGDGRGLIVSPPLQLLLMPSLGDSIGARALSTNSLLVNTDADGFEEKIDRDGGLEAGLRLNVGGDKSTSVYFPTGDDVRANNNKVRQWLCTL